MDRPVRPSMAARGPVGYWLLAGILAAFAAAKAVRYDTLDPDCFWHLRVADQLVRDGVGPVVDHLSFASRAEPWTPYSWLAELGMRAVWRAGGYRAAVATQATLEAAFALLLAGACGAGARWRRAAPPGVGAAAAVGVGLFLSLPYLSFRPVTLALVGMAACAWLVLARRGDAGLQGAANAGLGRAWWAVPIAGVLANVHLYALLMPAAIGLLVVGDAIDGRPWRRTATLAMAVAVASVATPMLPGVVRTAVFYGTGDAMVSGPVIAEMRPWGRDLTSVLVLAGIAVVAGRAGRRVPTGVLLWTAGAMALTLVRGRFAPVLAVAACPAMACGLSGGSDAVLDRRPVRVALAAACLAFVGRVAAAFPSARTPLPAWLDRLGPDVPGYPCAAADYVATRVPRVTGHVVNEFTWGGYLGWRLGDRWQVLLDGRTQVYPPSLWRATYLGTDADRRAFLAGVRADAAVVPTGHSRFRPALIDLGWTVVHHDPWAEVLVPGRSVASAE